MGQDVGTAAKLGVVWGGHLVEGPNQGLRLDPGAVGWVGAAALVEAEGRCGHKPGEGPGSLVGDAGHDGE